MDTGILGTFITLLLIKLNIYPAVRGEHGVDLVGSSSNFRLFSECSCILLYLRGNSRKFPELSYPNNHTSVKSKGVDFTGIDCGSCLWRKLKKVEVSWYVTGGHGVKVCHQCKPKCHCLKSG
jgi:hypothetical protein